VSKKVYLSGPDVFLANAMEIIELKAKMCADFGFEANLPQEQHVNTRCAAAPTDPAREIYEVWVGLMRTSDFGIFNLTPFRGASVDAGTAFELGMMTGLGKPTFGYTNIAGAYIDRIAPRQLLDPSTNAWTDQDDLKIENYGNADNLMIDESIATGGAPVVRQATPLVSRYQALDAFRDCLQQAKDYFAAHP
jgi:nucleoside 2-deoxyribosyltransferase